MEAREELLRFLRPEARPELRERAVQAALGLSGSADGRRLLLAGRAEVARALLPLTLAGDPAGDPAAHALLNLAAAAPEPCAEALRDALPALLRRLRDPGGPCADPLCALLANLSRQEAPCARLLSALQEQQEQEMGVGLAPLVDALCTRGAHLPHLGSLLCNLSQLPEARAGLLDRSRCLVQRLLPFTQFAGSAVLRRGVVGTLRNCCFDYECHDWLLSEGVDLLPFLLLPLAGPEEFPEEEMEKLPLDLQYLPQEKQREPDPDIRKMLLEAILLLTATKPGRQLVREKGTYVVLRELHKWETDPSALAACEKVVQVLIGDEPEAGMENLLKVAVPADVEEQLQRLDLEEQTRDHDASVP